MQKSRIKIFEINFNFIYITFFLKQIFAGKSYMRSCHYLFLKKNI